MGKPANGIRRKLCSSVSVHSRRFSEMRRMSAGSSPARTTTDNSAELDGTRSNPGIGEKVIKVKHHLRCVKAHRSGVRIPVCVRKHWTIFRVRNALLNNRQGPRASGCDTNNCCAIRSYRCLFLTKKLYLTGGKDPTSYSPICDVFIWKVGRVDEGTKTKHTQTQ